MAKGFWVLEWKIKIEADLSVDLYKYPLGESRFLTNCETRLQRDHPRNPIHHRSRSELTDHRSMPMLCRNHARMALARKSNCRME